MKRVESILVSVPETKDDDKLLLTMYWMEELKELGIDTLKTNAWHVLKSITDGELTNADYVARCRRRLQQQKPHLRGAKYMARYENQSNAQLELGYGHGN